eukprot:2135995-Prymnesium_polylepis.2
MAMRAVWVWASVRPRSRERSARVGAALGTSLERAMLAPRGEEFRGLMCGGWGTATRCSK